ncbi:antitoxin [Hydrogenophaga sp. NFH-34]|uniref:antitoxin n=1 Tax=Hydrogenophaga sp. NFH-34 TaxID=2744446 RepID=UPI001F17FF76|nr:antitoxin [Hydrogenophaga sp. NFH-34]
MTAINLGINSDSIQYEVALEILGQERQPLMTAIRLEREKAEPSEALLKYCQARLTAIDDLQSDLRSTDRDTIQQILDPQNRLFR